MSSGRSVWTGLIILLISVSLSGCGPSAEQQTATAVALTAAAPTRAPTTTPTRTPTRTPTLIPSTTSLPLVTEHPAPGLAPLGFPGLEISDYLETTSAGFGVSAPESGSSWTALYSISLRLLQRFPVGAYMEIHFEDPLDPSRAIVVPHSFPFPYLGQLIFESSPLTGVNCKTYWVETHIYSDSTKQTELGRHVQWIYAGFNIDEVQSVADLADGSTCTPISGRFTCGEEAFGGNLQTSNPLFSRPAGFYAGYINSDPSAFVLPDGTRRYVGSQYVLIVEDLAWVRIEGVETNNNGRAYSTGCWYTEDLLESVAEDSRRDMCAKQEHGFYAVYFRATSEGIEELDTTWSMTCP